ncbi:hypothetical protein PIROE2DRAFT_15473, partial [Piromyces sp. E2]
YLLNKLTLNESVENIVIDDILDRTERLKEMTTNNTVNNLLSKFIFYVKNVKIKIEDEEHNGGDKSDVKIKIKEEVESPRRKSSHFIIKNDEISDNAEEKVNDSENNLISNNQNDNEKNTDQKNNQENSNINETEKEAEKNNDDDNNDLNDDSIMIDANNNNDDDESQNKE